ncbi:MAG: class I SAM-dependent methyltransferase [Burkholderiales bacterium]|nr:class I SAM-dependent methyltransferase [Burkholderiales bacterium]
MHDPTLAPSPWVRRFASLLRPGGTVLDLACGSGRHVRWLAARGFAVTAVDCDVAALAGLQGIAAEVLAADLEAAPWPLPGRRFDAVLVTHYLWRPLFPALLGSLADGGVLVYETFADGQQAIGRPSRPEFLLRPGELLERAAGLRVVAYEDGFEAGPPPRFVQRIAAWRPDPAEASHPRFRLDGSVATGGPAGAAGALGAAT